jgi:hypothetical protein
MSLLATYFDGSATLTCRASFPPQLTALQEQLLHLLNLPASAYTN